MNFAKLLRLEKKTLDEEDLFTAEAYTYLGKVLSRKREFKEAWE
jgi:hypothetical protein